MHGRLKVRTTAEQQEAKRVEREKKLKIYTGATKKAFEKRNNREFDEEALKITGEILAVNPDFYSLWNFRKEIFNDFKEKRPKEELDKAFQDELYFLETCLKVNPKSYGTWHHRSFVMETMPTPDWKREIKLCNTFLQYDERNFHCWDYRRFVVGKASISAAEEFEFTTEKIANNFSDYSSWHYRSKLLPILHPDKTHPSGVNEEILLKEFETVQNAFFTDPNDQSAWFYHRWLLGRHQRNLEINTMFVSRKDRRVMVTTTKPVMIDCNNPVALKINDKEVKVEWRNQKSQRKYSTLWLADNVLVPDGSINIQVLMDTHRISQLLSLKSDESESLFTLPFKEGNRFSYELTSSTSETLQRELEAIVELYEIEPDNKWVILTLMSLMKSLDPLKYEQEILQQISHLQNLDPKRKTYYDDLRSKILVENTLEAFELNQQCLDLSDKKLTVLYHTSLLPFISELHLEGNQLVNLKNFEFLQCLKNLILDSNKICDINGLRGLNSLEKLSLKDNLIQDVNDLKVLQTCPNLNTLNIKGNTVCSEDKSLNELRQLLPGVSITS
ncbi:hypothetical protein SNE40_019459 [Patella caerulea]|uniref:Geranylgeranyl transferase type-2 subunit alpha n=1 Tax=Patella caerulea TaxID=87958 RepID=A0AAN8P9M3_PATCE